METMFEKATKKISEMSDEFIGVWRENNLKPAQFKTPNFICEVTDKSFTFTPKEMIEIPTFSDLNYARMQIVNYLAEQGII